MKNCITFYYEDNSEKDIFSPIAEEAKKRNFNTKFTKNFNQSSDIGFYCKSTGINLKSKHPVIFLGGMDQGRDNWPNAWQKENWNKFNLGFLPGKTWTQMWKKMSWFYKCRPKFGVFDCGWPKADITSNKRLLYKKSKKIRKKYGVSKTKYNVLYAPSFECNDKQLDVANAISKLKNCELVVKHWIEDKKKNPDLWGQINRANLNTKKILGHKAKIIKPSESFIDILPLINILITDESSVAYEALLLDIPTISVNDWKIQRHKHSIPRPVKPANICFITYRENLQIKIQDMIKKKNYYHGILRNKKKIYFSNLGSSSKKIIDNLNLYLKNKNPTNSREFIKPTHKKSNLKLFFLIVKNYVNKMKFENLVVFFRNLIRKSFILSFLYKFLKHILIEPILSMFRYYLIFNPKYDVESKVNFEGFEENNFFLSSLKKSKVYLEYGSGNSTLVAKRENKNFFSVESDKNFFNYLKKNFFLNNYFLKDLGIVKYFSYPIFFNFKKKSLSVKALKYSNDILEILEKKRIVPDLILVDGRYRVLTSLCLHQFFSKNKKKFIIIIDDYQDRNYYHILNKFFKVKMVGRFGVFYKLKKNKASELINHYSLDYR